MESGGGFFNHPEIMQWILPFLGKSPQSQENDNREMEWDGTEV